MEDDTELRMTLSAPDRAARPKPKRVVSLESWSASPSALGLLATTSPVARSRTRTLRGWYTGIRGDR
jgi:hypothetical protein